MARKSVYRGHNRSAYRSRLEDSHSKFLETCQKKVRYETFKIEWEDLKYRKYTPDFLLDNGIIIESKGFFDAEDRRKHLCVREQHPELDIRFVFDNALAKLNKGSTTTYADWCDANGFKWSHKVIPQEWIDESGECPTDLKLVKLKTEKKK